MEPPRENSPSTPSRYLNSYLQQNPTELFHQNFTQRQLPNQQFYAADNLTTNNKAYLKRHHQNYHDKSDSDREKKYDKYDAKKLVDDNNLHQHAAYDSSFSNDTYPTTNIATVPVAGTTSTPSTAASAVTPQQKGVTGAKSLSNGKKTKGRVKIKMEYIENKLRRYTTFSKRKTGIMKKAYELSTLTGTQVMLLVASETGHVYTFATRKLQPMITSEAGKTLIQTCLNSPDIPAAAPSADQRMSATGFEETELNYSISDLGDNPGDKDKDDITSTDESQVESCDESSNDENFLIQNQQLQQRTAPVVQQVVTAAAVPTLRNFEKEKSQQQVEHQINEKMMDNHKLLLESLSNLPQNILQSWIQSGQLQVSMDEDGINQCISIPFAVQRENSQEIITKKIPIKLLGQKIKTEME